MPDNTSYDKLPANGALQTVDSDATIDGPTYRQGVARRIASASIPESLLEAVDAAASDAGLTRNAYMRRVLEAATDGQLRLQSEEARTAEMIRLRFASDRAAVRELSRQMVAASGESDLGFSP